MMRPSVQTPSTSETISLILEEADICRDYALAALVRLWALGFWGLLLVAHSGETPQTANAARRKARSVPEMPFSREHHRHAALVCGGDHFRVAYGAAGLDDGADAGIGEDVGAGRGGGGGG